MKKKIILSYDYELFFGDRSGTVLKSIIEPTDMLMKVMEHNGFRGNFFVDYLMFRELEKQSEKQAVADLELLKDQIRDMIRRGHRIELHLHPHWVDAKYNGDGTWDFSDFSHYSLSSLDENTIVDMFVRGTEYLTSLAQEIDPKYKIVAFRAGGWAVQPFDKLKRGFLEAGIKIDSSTSFGIYKYQKDSYYDFRQMPDKCMYHFEDDVCEEIENGQFVEVPITSFHNSFLLFIYNRYVYNRTDYFKSFADGTHTRVNTVKTKKKMKDKIIEKFDPNYRKMMNFSSMTKSSIWYSLFRSSKGILCFIDHPKDVSKGTLEGLSYLGHHYNSISYIDLI